MSAQAPAQVLPRASADVSFSVAARHRILIVLIVVAVIAAVATLSVYGFDYYRLPPVLRTRSPKHAMLRSSGWAGIRTGVLGALGFAVLYLYAFRKKWARLGRIGKTKNWLDYHVIAGVSVPILVTYHSGFRFGGLVGVAYWIMIAVVISGFVGRYLYAQVPRSLSAAEFTLTEIETMKAEIAAQLAGQRVFPPEHLERLLRVPDRAEVRAMPLARAAILMVGLDLVRPFQVAALRREALSGWQRAVFLGGLLASRNPDLERVVELARRQAWLMVKIAFLDRAREIFHLWHVVHRPFSYSLAVLVALHF
jgi:hypothetical protein